MRERYGKYFSNEDIYKVVKNLYENNIPTISGSMIIGGPFEDDASLTCTLDIKKELFRNCSRGF